MFSKLLFVDGITELAIEIRLSRKSENRVVTSKTNI